jgi:two-component system sensor histidine kinase BarA
VGVEPEAEFLRITVTDTGRGIPPEAQKLLFRKFQQAGPSLLTRDTTRGTGLGLYISKLMAEGMGGRMALDHSTVGKGTAFSVLIPRVSTAEAATLVK